MPPRGCGIRRSGGRPPIKRRMVVRSPTQKGAVNWIGPATPPSAAPPPALPLVGLDQATVTLMWEMFHAMLQTMVAIQQAQVANSSTTTRETRYLRDFKRYDPRIFNGASEDLIVAELWLSSIETIFYYMNCPDDLKVSLASFMLRDDAEIWWEFTREVLSPDGGVISWPQFKEAFWEEYYSEEARLQKQQEFTQLTQNGRSVGTYGKDFIRLMRFALELVDTEIKKVQRFIFGLDEEIRCIVGAIAPTTYDDALRSATALEGDSVEELWRPIVLTPVVGQKRHYDQVAQHHQPLIQPQQQVGRYHKKPKRGQQPGRQRGRGDYKPLCCECGKNHWGQCLARSGACFRCGQQGHISRNCLGRTVEHLVN
ncbi:uncharacterized protein LOC111798850 [Cucurbita pepo subsp. pepo]|uniref:uncharacterized protein LOC111798850 n=1 Tax=Cucurbita pepo subsp. pepo TaxID=3664 RepID=UPI000C9D65EF|nr:uncharacterized protein LOC111798850 [Cucurbita pepo subsp. pepo]